MGEPVIFLHCSPATSNDIGKGSSAKKFDLLKGDVHSMGRASAGVLRLPGVQRTEKVGAKILLPLLLGEARWGLGQLCAISCPGHLANCAV